MSYAFDFLSIVMIALKTCLLNPFKLSHTARTKNCKKKKKKKKWDLLQDSCNMSGGATKKLLLSPCSFNVGHLKTVWKGRCFQKYFENSKSLLKYFITRFDLDNLPLIFPNQYCSEIEKNISENLLFIFKKPIDFRNLENNFWNKNLFFFS